ncbi:hypothetical protein METBIDRAFT_92342 [Metschnikowia bicuspidata var. bicuspidata NRRL YB-4993]|uniref:Uncharacterized protein n=1 Tax=Metschnikowia bicuspidata var. bicuspidata NRRL YB-4993 TaxID=869754 RepID=A0A1A0HF59_9ASCO|nr:hypothetical protein METBIDRAFT_92342 [Metschnikowia bicuspidata var. bicuspidata NRRL YB-4993]OBA22769.1 hypothetical protein METBIDRAFT_92342 [Metschnikowia bicuspidata var. bicuspidata NRRL YB-4993]
MPEATGNVGTGGKFVTVKKSVLAKRTSVDPAGTKSKPGPHVSLQQSPFYNTTTAGPPPVKCTEAGLLPLARRMTNILEPRRATRRTTAAKSASKAESPISLRGERADIFSQDNLDAASGLAGLAGLASTDIFEIGSADMAPAVKPPQTDMKEPELQMQIPPPSAPPVSSVADCALMSLESDSDSDFERLLASAPKSATKKYTKKRTF